MELAAGNHQQKVTTKARDDDVKVSKDNRKRHIFMLGTDSTERPSDLDRKKSRIGVEQRARNSPNQLTCLIHHHRATH